MQNVFSSIKGTLLEVLARRMKPEDAQYLAKQWGFVASVNSLGVKSQATPTPIDPQGEVSVSANSMKPSTNAATSQHLSPSAALQESLKRMSGMKDSNILHPCFGELLADLKYKRVYLTDVRSLVSSPIWEKQRILRTSRIELIVQSKLKAKKHSREISFPGVITFYDNKSNKTCGIVDGQHRAGALILMAQRGLWDPDSRNILVDVFDVEKEEEISTLFKDINSAEPVKLIDMPDDNTEHTSDRIILTDAADKLAEMFPEMFKPSSRCKPPHLNVDNLRDELFQSEFLKRNNIKSTEEIIQRLMLINKELDSKSEKEWKKIVGESKALDIALKKAMLNKFYLGMDKSWM